MDTLDPWYNLPKLNREICIHFYKNEYKYYKVNIKRFNLINLLLSIIRDYNTLNPNDKIIAPIGVSYVMLVKR